MHSIDIDVDRIIDKLLEMKDKKTLKQVNLSEQEVRSLCIKSREVFISQPVLVELEAPLKVCGIEQLSFQLYNNLIQAIHMDNTTIC